MLPMTSSKTATKITDSRGTIMYRKILSNVHIFNFAGCGVEIFVCLKVVEMLDQIGMQQHAEALQ